MEKAVKNGEGTSSKLAGFLQRGSLYTNIIMA